MVIRKIPYFYLCKNISREKKLNIDDMMIEHVLFIPKSPPYVHYSRHMNVPVLSYFYDIDVLVGGNTKEFLLY